MRENLQLILGLVAGCPHCRTCSLSATECMKRNDSDESALKLLEKVKECNECEGCRQSVKATMAILKAEKQYNL